MINDILPGIQPQKCLYNKHEDVTTHTKSFPHCWPFLSGVNPNFTGGSPQKPSLRSFGVFFDVALNKLLNKESNCLWFETPWRWRDFIVNINIWTRALFTKTLSASFYPFLSSTINILYIGSLYIPGFSYFIVEFVSSRDVCMWILAQISKHG